MTFSMPVSLVLPAWFKLPVVAQEVVLYGVSEPYKESANCRMEAQYAMQRLELEAMIPLMMERYKASGAHDRFQTSRLLGCMFTLTALCCRLAWLDTGESTVRRFPAFLWTLAAFRSGVYRWAGILNFTART